MTRVATRLARLEAAVPTPVAERVHNLARLTPPQLDRMAGLRVRVAEVGLDGLSEDEFWGLAEISAILRADDPPARTVTMKAAPPSPPFGTSPPLESKR